MTDGVDDDLGFRDLVENQIRIRQRGHTPDGGIVRACANTGMSQQKIDDCMKPGLHSPGALRRMGRDVVED